jgi:methionyl aminopeptidase
MDLPAETLRCLREAGRIAAEARDRGARLIVPGASLREVCVAVEDHIRARGGGVAFPAQSSRNGIAAHYCASPEDETRYERGDLAKLDIGVHVDGWVVDTATTVAVGANGDAHPLVAAVEEALGAAIRAARPGVPVRALSEAIETTLRRRGVRPLRNLCGHGVGRWTVHRPPAIPNVADRSPERLESGAVVAIEPFATDGRGEVVENGPPEVFRLDPQRDVQELGEEPVVDAMRSFRGLPFSRRQLAAHPREAVERTIRALRAARHLMAYPPLVEEGGRPVAQAEHTIYVGPEGVEVLTGGGPEGDRRGA